MDIIYLVKHPAFYFFLGGLSVSILYTYSRKTFRKRRSQIFILSILLMLLGVGVFIFEDEWAAFAPFLFIPLYSTFFISWIERQYFKENQKELPDTSFWYLTGEPKSDLDNNWNTALLLSIFVVPITTCIFLLIAIS